MKKWQMHEAKARLSEVVKRAQVDGPQDITVYGRTVAVVLSVASFKKISGSSQLFVEFMKSSPLYGLEDIDLERDRSPARELSL